MAILFHGPARLRAERIRQHGPNPDFVEPGGGPDSAESFSTGLVFGPFPLGKPEEYACQKAAGFPDEGGPAMLVMDVPDDLIALAIDPVYFPLSQGIVPFDRGAGLEHLRAAWSGLSRRVISLQC